MAKNFVRRGDWYHYMRRVPKRVSSYDNRSHIRIALKTQSQKEAVRMAAIYDDYIEKYWGGLIRSGSTDPTGQGHRQARDLARAYGFAYKDMTDLVGAPAHEILGRVEAVNTGRAESALALLGNAKASPIRLSECVDRFWALCADRLVSKNEQQRRKYRNPRRAAMKNFIQVIGDLSLHQVERSHALRFRNWLLERIASGHLVGNSANKQLSFIKDIMATVARDLEITTDFKVIFAETNVKQITRPRPPFEAGWVQSKFINSGKLNALNEDARMLVYMMIETGAREAELIGLEPEDFFLDAEIPHIWIRENNLRALKTASSDRRIPLVGISLFAAQQIAPNGFTRYHKHPESASAAANKFIKNNHLRPTQKHKLYSLRHTFKDRLRDAGAPEEIMMELMGHKKSGPQYGHGYTMQKKQKWLLKIAFDKPKWLNT